MEALKQKLIINCYTREQSITAMSVRDITDMFSMMAPNLLSKGIATMEKF
tara:strand:- start:615 stop:764 length:150 start_codon:yes stop_codon:yes gene_type:complete